MKSRSSLVFLAACFMFVMVGCASTHETISVEEPLVKSALTDKTEQPAGKKASIDVDEAVASSNVQRGLDDGVEKITDPDEDDFDEELEDEFEDEFEDEENGIRDPLYWWNKGWYHFNDKFYFWIAKPAAQGYSFIIPEDGRVMIKNFFTNVAMPVRFVNNLLQAQFKHAGEELLRFGVNTTAGVLGLADAATDLGLKRHDEDFGQTLGVYGLGHGIYVVWPLFGPSSLRDTVGRVGDWFLDPVSYIEPAETSFYIKGGRYVNDTSFRIGDYEALKEAAIDPYTALRDAYFQLRSRELKE